MAFPLAVPLISWGKLITASVVSGAGFTVGQIAVDSATGGSEEGLDIVLDDDSKELLEDIVKTNKALLLYRNVRQELYEPLNIDST